MVNKVILVGNLAADPEVKATAKGVYVANIRLATNTYAGKDEEGHARRTRRRRPRPLITRLRLRLAAGPRYAAAASVGLPPTNLISSTTTSVRYRFCPASSHERVCSRPST